MKDNNQNKNISILSKVTNLDNEKFIRFRSENGETISESVFDLVSLMDYCKPVFFKPDVKTGKVNFSIFDASNLKGISDCNVFAHMIVRYFYDIVQSDVNAISDKLKDINVSDLSEKNAIAYKVIQSRIDDAKAICEAAHADIDCIQAAKNVAKVVYGCKVKTFDDDVIKAIGKVMSELESLYTSDCNDGQLPNVKILRDKVSLVMKALFPVDEKGIVKKVTRKCTDKQARDIFSVYYKGRKLDSKGIVIGVNAKDNQIVNEIMFICLQAMQVNSTEIINAEKPEKAEKPVKAEKPEKTVK